MKKKLYVPHPGYDDCSKLLISEAKRDIYPIFIAGSPDYVGTSRSNISSPQIEDMRLEFGYTIPGTGINCAFCMTDPTMNAQQPMLTTPMQKSSIYGGTKYRSYEIMDEINNKNMGIENGAT